MKEEVLLSPVFGVRGWDGDRLRGVVFHSDQHLDGSVVETGVIVSMVRDERGLVAVTKDGRRYRLGFYSQFDMPVKEGV